MAEDPKKPKGKGEEWVKSYTQTLLSTYQQPSQKVYPSWQELLNENTPDENSSTVEKPGDRTRSGVGEFGYGVGQSVTKQMPGAIQYGVGQGIHSLGRDAQLEAINQDIRSGKMTLNPDPSYYDTQIQELDGKIQEWDRINDSLIKDKQQFERDRAVRSAGMGRGGGLVKPMEWDKQRAYDQYQENRNLWMDQKTRMEIIRDEIQKNGLEGARERIDKAPVTDTWAQRTMKRGKDLLQEYDQIASSQEHDNFWFKSGGFVANVVPSLAATVAAIPTGGTSLGLVAPVLGIGAGTALGLSSGGQMMYEYDKYMGDKADPYQRLAVGVGGMLAELIPEYAHVTSVLPAGTLGKAFAKNFGKTLVNNPEQATGLLAAFIKDNPKIGKQLVMNTLKQMGQEGEEESVTELAQSILQNYYKNPEDQLSVGAILGNMAKAAGMGALMGGFIGVPQTFAQNLTQKRIREKRGTVTLAEDTSSGEVVELMNQDASGKYLAYSRDGRELHLSPENIGQRITVPFADFQAALKGQTVNLDNEIKDQTKAEKTNLDAQIQAKIQQITHKDGAIYEAKDIHGNGFYVIDGNPYGNGTVVAIGPDNQPVQKAAKSLFGTDEKSQPQRFEVQDYYTQMRQVAEMKANEQEIIRRANTGTLTPETILKETLVGGETGRWNGMEVQFTGQKDERGRLQVKFPDPNEPGEEATQWINPEELQLNEGNIGQTTDNTQVTNEQSLTEEPMQPVPVAESKPKRTLTVGKTELPLIETGQGTWDVEKEFTTSDQAKAAKKKLSEKYPRLSFTVEDRSDKADPFSPAQYTITVKAKTQANDTNLSKPVAGEERQSGVVPAEPQSAPGVSGTQPASVDSGTQPELTPAVEAPITENLSEPNVESINPAVNESQENQGQGQETLLNPPVPEQGTADTGAATVAPDVSSARDMLVNTAMDIGGFNRKDAELYVDELRKTTNTESNEDIGDPESHLEVLREAVNIIGRKNDGKQFMEPDLIAGTDVESTINLLKKLNPRTDEDKEAVRIRLEILEGYGDYINQIVNKVFAPEGPATTGKNLTKGAEVTPQPEPKAEVAPKEVQKQPEKPAVIPDEPNADTQDWRVWQSEYGTRADDIYVAWEQETAETPYAKLTDWQKRLLGNRVNRVTFERFGDPNWIGRNIIVNWLTKDPKDPAGHIDGIAQEYSDDFNIEITPNDIVEFIRDNPKNYVRKTTDLQKALETRYKQVAGHSIKRHKFDTEVLTESEKQAIRELPIGFKESIYKDGIKDLQTLEQLKDLFGQFPYTQEDYETVRRYLQAHPEGITLDEEGAEDWLHDAGTGTQGQGVGQEAEAPKVETLPDWLLEDWTEEEPSQAEAPTEPSFLTEDWTEDEPTQAPENATQPEIGLSEVPTYQDLTPDQKREFEVRKKDLEEKIKVKQEEIGQAKRALQTQKNKLEKSRVSQTGLLDQPEKPQFAGDLLFALPKQDFSQENIKRAIQEQEGVLAVKSRELQDLLTRKDRIVEEILYGVKAQTRIEMPEAQPETTPEPEQAQTEQKDTKGDPARLQELKNSLAEGEMIIKSGKTVSGRKMSNEELDAVKRTIENTKRKIRELGGEVAETSLLTGINEMLSPYGWKAEQTSDGINLINGNGKNVAKVIIRGNRYVVTDISGQKLLSGNSDLFKAIEKTATQYFYATNKDNPDVNFRITEEQLPYTQKQIDAVFENSKEKFGTTESFRTAGYLLPDGDLLQFGNDKDRGFDHRNISDAFYREDPETGEETSIFDPDVYFTDRRWIGSSTPNMLGFMQIGAIRVMGESNGLGIATMPTSEQFRMIRKYAGQKDGYVIIDLEVINNENPSTYSVEYDRGTPPDRIINDIKNYFNNGVVPVAPNVLDDAMFRMIGSSGIANNPVAMVNQPVAIELEKKLNPKKEYYKNLKDPANREVATKIFSATGFQRGTDGQWRYEEDDSSFVLNVSPAFKNLLTMGVTPGKEITTKITTFIDKNWGGFNEYPQLLDYQVLLYSDPMDPDQFGIDVADKTIQVNTATIPWFDTKGQKNPRSGQKVKASRGLYYRVGFLHELQHAIQNEEGLSGGANLNNIPPQIQARYDQLTPEQVIQELDAISPSWVSIFPGAKERILQGDQLSINKAKGLLAYSYNIGENEAYATGFRMDMSPEERRKVLPSDSEITDREGQWGDRTTVSFRANSDPDAKEFQKWFGQSKVVNLDGSPKVMYHGTPNGGFTEFSNEYRGSGADTFGFGDWGNGFYFTPLRESADSYANIEGAENPQVYRAYLKMNNPLDLQLKSAIDRSIMQYVRENNQNILSIPEEKIVEIIHSFGLSQEDYDFINSLEDTIGDNWGDFDIAGMAKAQGYDGIISPDGTEYVAFDPDQIRIIGSDVNVPEVAGIDFRFTPKFAANKAKLKELEGYFNRIKANAVNLPVNISIVESRKDLPQWLQDQIPVSANKITGAYIPNRNTAFFVLNDITDTKEAFLVWAHEIGWHYGIRNLIPEPYFKGFLEKIYNDLGEAEIHRLVPSAYWKLSKAKQADEYMAFLTEKIATTEDAMPKEISTWRRIMEEFRNLLQRVFSFKHKITTDEAEQIARASFQSIYNPRMGRGGFRNVYQGGVPSIPVGGTTPGGNPRIGPPSSKGKGPQFAGSKIFSGKPEGHSGNGKGQNQPVGRGLVLPGVQRNTLDDRWDGFRISGMTRQEFESNYYQHTDLRSKTPEEAQQLRDKIEREGFTSSSPNVVSITTGTPANIIARNYQTQKGKLTYIIHRRDLIDTPNGYKIRPGWKPYDGFVVTPEYDGQPVWELVEKQIDPGFRAQSVTDTPEFKNWFGDSKVVDETGQPMLVYHGTDKDFTEFEIGWDVQGMQGGRENLGIFFGNYDQARDIMERGVGYGGGISAGPKIMPVYLSIKNPLRLESDAKFWMNPRSVLSVLSEVIDTRELEKLVETHERSGVIYTKKPKSAVSEFEVEGDSVAQVIRPYLINLGYDGIIYPNEIDAVDGDVDTSGDSYIVFSPTQIKSATGNNGQFDPENEDINFRIGQVQNMTNQQFAEEFQDWIPTMEKVEEKSLLNLLDKTLHDARVSVRHLLDKIRERGIDISHAENTWEERDRAAGKNRYFIEQFNEQYKTPLMEGIKTLIKTKGVTYEEVVEYLKSKHGIERNIRFTENSPRKEKVIASGIPIALQKRLGYKTNKEARENVTYDQVMEYHNQVVDAFESKIGQASVFDLWDSVRKATAFTVDRWHKDGIISTEQWLTMTGPTGYRHYVPLRGWKGETAEDVFEYLDGQLGGAFNPNKRAFGRFSESDDPIPYIISMGHSAIVAGDKNRTKLTLLNLARTYKDQIKDLIRVQYEYEVQDDKGNWVNVGTEKPADFNELYQAKMARIRKDTSLRERNTKGNASQHEIHVFENGQHYVLLTDPQVASAVNGDNMIRAEILTDTIGKFTRFWAALTTSKNPAFFIPNTIRDARFAFRGMWADNNAKMAGQYLKNLSKASGAITRRLGGKAPKNQYDRMLKDFYEQGAATGYVQLQKIDELKNEVRKDIKRLKTIDHKANPMRYLRALIAFEDKMTGRLADWSETVSRFATYITYVENGASKQEAATRAKESTVNFDRKGTLSGAIGSMWAFFNARVQGIMRYTDLWKKNPKKMALFAAADITAGVLMMMLMDLWWGDDEDEEGTKRYDKMNPFLRRNYLTIPIPGTEDAVSIPNIHGFSLFYTLGATMYDVLTGRTSGKQAVGVTADAFFNNLFPIDMGGMVNKDGKLTIRPFVPTFAVPMYDIAQNEDFAGRFIYREPFTKAMEKTAAQSQLYKKGTNEVLVGITDFLFELSGGDKDLKTNYYFDEKGNRRKVLLDFNPSKIEHYLEGYLSGKGQFYNQLFKTTLIPAVETAAGSIREDQTVRQSLQEAYQDVGTWDIPIFNRFIRGTSQDPVFDEYRAKREVADQIISHIKTLKSAGRYREGVNTFSGKDIRQAEKVKSLQKRIEDIDERLTSERLSDETRSRQMELKRSLMRKINEIEFDTK